MRDLPAWTLGAEFSDFGVTRPALIGVIMPLWHRHRASSTQGQAGKVTHTNFRRASCTSDAPSISWCDHAPATVNRTTGSTIASGSDAKEPCTNAGEPYQDFLTKLAQASGIETPTRADLARLDRKRKKKGSNDDWTHPHDPDAKITKMKDGRTHLAHKAEHAVDLETGAVVAVTVQDADEGDVATSRETLIDGAENIETVVPAGAGLHEVVADKGYHSNQELVDLEALGVRSYISEPDRGRRSWKGKAVARDAVYRNRRRIRGARGQRLLRLRGERLERPFAHLYETGRLRRVHLRGHDNIRKRLLVHAAALNLGLLMRRVVGVGTPRSLQGRVVALLGTLIDLLRHLWELLPTSWVSDPPDWSFNTPSTGRHEHGTVDLRMSTYATGC